MITQILAIPVNLFCMDDNGKFYIHKSKLICTISLQ